MKNNEYINRKVEDLLSGADGASRATPTPFLFTRVMARIKATRESSWEKAGRFISRPAFAIAGLGIVIILNAMALSTLNHAKASNVRARQSTMASDYFSSNNIAIDDIENTTP